MGGTVNQQEQFDEPKAANGAMRSSRREGHASPSRGAGSRRIRLSPSMARSPVILDGIDRLDEEELARSIARANKGQQIGGDPGPIS
jgi:hypothetical protein